MNHARPPGSRLPIRCSSRPTGATRSAEVLVFILVPDPVARAPITSTPVGKLLGRATASVPGRHDSVFESNLLALSVLASPRFQTVRLSRNAALEPRPWAAMKFHPWAKLQIAFKEDGPSTAAAVMPRCARELRCYQGSAKACPLLGGQAGGER